ncbi:MAG: hypothetical protein ACTSU5_02150 [Promethearchaeota archaeon]
MRSSSKLVGGAVEPGGPVDVGDPGPCDTCGLEYGTVPTTSGGWICERCSVEAQCTRGEFLEILALQETIGRVTGNIFPVGVVAYIWGRVEEWLLEGPAGGSNHAPVGGARACGDV